MEKNLGHRVPETRGHRLFRAWLRREKLSLRLAAVRLGITSTAVSNYKSLPPRRTPTMDVILAIQIASRGAVCPEDWLTGEEQGRLAAVADRMPAASRA